VGAVIRPIGTDPGTEFAGSFDGGGHVIRNLAFSYTKAGITYMGLFGSIGAEGRVSDLGLEDAAIAAGEGPRYVGILCGRNAGAVERCYVIGELSGGAAGKYIGGLAGEDVGSLADCYSFCDLALGPNSQYLGGLVGSGIWGSIARCYAVVTFLPREGSQYCGGLAGHGYNVTQCFFYYTPVYGNESLNNGRGRQLSWIQIVDRAWFSEWDFDTVWAICQGKDSPRLRWQGSPCKYVP